MSQSGAAQLVALHIASEPSQPAPFAPRILSASTTASTGPDPEAAEPAEPDWQALGVEARWIGTDTSTCAAVLSPVAGPATGSEEFKRYTAGARQRSETALVIASIGAGRTPTARNVFDQGFDHKIHLPNPYGWIGGRLLPAGVRPQLADNLDSAERDLALRLRNRRPDSPWWGLTLVRGGPRPGYGHATIAPQPRKGELRPLLVDSLGNPVAGVWAPDDGSARWFVVPFGTDRGQLVDWLMQKALPLYVPGQLVRARSPLVRDPAFATRAEILLLAEQAEHQRAYELRKAELDVPLAKVREEADRLRLGLMYGTGRQLEDAVREVLAAADFTVTALDDELGTQSADLLAELGGRRILVEVKSAASPAPQDLVGKLYKHMSTWPSLKRDAPLDGGLLVVNHQTRLPPQQRPAEVYSRGPFADSLKVPVVGSLQLLNWWREEDWAAIRQAVLGDDSTTAQPSADSATGPLLPGPIGPAAPASRLARWRR
ncbi:hypothetical protein ACIRPK_26905 [Kitasatospora sp. NPDC101801]|uniref:hypothetical protein n=1 Tax=Kitasatospora sp. NPDC101801 TaxID=3364103 RepID=UPI0037FD0C59